MTWRALEQFIAKIYGLRHPFIFIIMVIARSCLLFALDDLVDLLWIQYELGLTFLSVGVDPLGEPFDGRLSIAAF